jgi:uncharacterized Zn finger protein (UPF0148 family)
MNNDILKKGADYLLKGGTLLSEPCQNCNGLLIKFKGNITCLNCQKSDSNDFHIESDSNLRQEKKELEIKERPQIKANTNKINDSYKIENYINLLLQIEETITKRMVENNKAISIENDLDKQQKNLKSLFLYLKVLKKLKEIQRPLT